MKEETRVSNVVQPKTLIPSPSMRENDKKWVRKELFWSVLDFIPMDLSQD